MLEKIVTKTHHNEQHKKTATRQPRSLFQPVFQHRLSQCNITTNLTTAEPGAETQHRGLLCNITLQHYNGRKEKKAGGTVPMLHAQRRDIAE